MTVAGIGCRRGATAEEVLAAIAAARARHGLARLDALAALDRKRGETGIAEAAARLGLPLLIAEPAGDAPGMLTRSAASLAATGTGSASEAAAAVKPTVSPTPPQIFSAHWSGPAGRVMVLPPLLIVLG